MAFHRHVRKHSSRRLDIELLEGRELLTVDMTPQEQLLLELVNRARANPLAEAARLGIGLNDDVEPSETISADFKAPLAPHQALVNASVEHVLDMLRRDYFGHDTPEGVSPSDRAIRAGYPVGAGENIAWYGETDGINRNQEVELRHNALVRSVGHRVNMMRDMWREIGPGVRYGEYTEDKEGTPVNYESIMVGTLFGNRGGDVFLTGVVLTDAVLHNNFYDLGEGMGGVTVTAVHEATGEIFTDHTPAAGGYSIQVPGGYYTLTATGGGLTSPIVVRGIQVTDKNRKIDFNQRVMPTASMSGTVYRDVNGNGRRDPNDPPLIGRQVYVDIDLNNQFDLGEPVTSSGNQGGFQFDSFYPGSYSLRQIVPDGWSESSMPTVTLQGSNVAGLTLGVQPMLQPPTAVNDTYQIVSGATFVLDLLANDHDSDGELALNSIQTSQGPLHGTLHWNGARTQVSYQSNLRYVGADQFSYTVQDATGLISQAATVSIQVTSPIWRNPAIAFDVNGDGFVTSRDVLTIIRDINRNGVADLFTRSVSNGPPYLDVNGDNFVTARDALAVVREINRATSIAPPPLNVGALDLLWQRPRLLLLADSSK